MEFDECFMEACKLVVERGSASSGTLQRVYRIGFNRAARIIDQMEAVGIVGPEKGTKPREVLVSEDELEVILKEYIYGNKNENITQEDADGSDYIIQKELLDNTDNGLECL